MQVEERRKQLRLQMRETRERLSSLEVENRSRLLFSKLEANNLLQQAQTIMGFVAIKNEVNLTEWLIKKLNQAKTIILPRVEADGQISGVKFTDWGNTIKSKLGIIEPLGEPFPEQEIDAVLVPGLVFDLKGYRLGYGKGYYDRFLPKLRKDSFKCGVCFDFQIVESIFPHEKDIPVDCLITEQQTLLINKRP